MRLRVFFGLAAVLAVPLTAQTVSPVLPALSLQQTTTTGMIGFTTNQTARLNVLNLNAVPSATTTTTTAQPANCTVELQFLDDKGTVLKSATVTNFAPGTATSLDLLRSALPSANPARAEIRGSVVVNPSPTPVASAAATGYCSVITTLEVFDTLTGGTVAFTSDTRAVAGPILIGGISAMPLR